MDKSLLIKDSNLENLIQLVISVKSGNKEFCLYHHYDGKWIAGIGNSSSYVLIGETPADIESGEHNTPRGAVIDLIDRLQYWEVRNKEHEAEILEHAKKMIEERGWHQGAVEDNSGRLNMDSALRISYNQSDVEGASFDELNIPSTVKWEMEAGRTLEEVYDWFDGQIWLRRQ